MPATDRMDRFIARWEKSGAGERSNFQSFMSELCDALDVPRPEPATENEPDNTYVFERNVVFRHDDGSQTLGRIDLYKRGSFVLEGKQSRKRQEDARAREAAKLGLALNAASTRAGSGPRAGRGWDAVMAAAKAQAEAYAKALPREDGWPPFILVVDVAHVIEVYADFSLQGKHYAQFPDRQNYRIRMEDLRREEVQARLRAIWTDPFALDPARRTAEVTREIAALLAKLSQSLEKRGHSAGSVAAFLMRCLFTMFAEDVGLLARDSFKRLLEDHIGRAQQLHLALPHLWQAMNSGGYSPTLGDTILKFNGGLFRDASAVPLDEQDLEWLLLAAKRDWTNVEPAIFGTLLERALEPGERHKLGAHYTPRAYVERLVVPTIIEPLTDDWRSVQAEAADLLKHGEKDKAREAVRAFHAKLCATRVLDPACGTGNFLYVAMELMKRLEGEVLEMLSDLGEDQYLLELDRHTVDPHQFLGLEINPRAVPIAELVLWIGYLQWHFRTRGKVMPAEPVLKAFANIKEQDAVLAFDRKDILRDERGVPRTRWDGVSMKVSPVTGEEIPDPDKQTPIYEYVNPRRAAWPQADFAVGNPPFIGKGVDMRESLGDGYVDALNKLEDGIGGSADFVMWWWDAAARLVAAGKLNAFGLISTNSIGQSLNRKVMDRYLTARHPISIIFAIPDHPWLKSPDKAGVRIAMTVAEDGIRPGTLLRVVREEGLNTDTPLIFTHEENGCITADLRIGASTHAAVELFANRGLASMGPAFGSRGFLVNADTRDRLMAQDGPIARRFLKPLLSGRDLVQKPRRSWVIDAQKVPSGEELRKIAPAIFQYLLDHVRPARSANRDQRLAKNWWKFRRTNTDYRSMIAGLNRYVATTETAKHRTFEFVSAHTVCEHGIVSFGIEDAYFFGILSSRLHVTWTLASGGTLEDRPRYNKTVCFDPFPFPTASEGQRARIRTLGERLDAFRKERLAAHPNLTMTKLYNVLEKLRADEPLSEAERAIHEAGLVSVLKQIHDDLDAAVADAYGWPADLSDEDILERLVALNRERAAEEARGLVRWLRPEFQAPKEARVPRQVEAELVGAETKAAKPAFPKAPADQVAALRTLLAAQRAPIRAGELARKFAQGKRIESRVSDLLEILAAIGQAQTENGTRYFAAK